MFGFSEEQFSGFFATYGVAAFILFMLFIVGELAYTSKAGRTGTLVLFFVLGFGMFGFAAKSVVQLFWRI